MSLIFIAVLIFFGCESNNNCDDCASQNWVHDSRKTSEKLISQIKLVLLEQNQDTISSNFQGFSQKKFLIARDTLSQSYKGETLKWFREHPQSWISIDSNSVTVSIKICEKWCKNIPYSSQLYLIQTPLNPEILWEGALAEIEELINIKDDWFLVKRGCNGCGM